VRQHLGGRDCALPAPTVPPDLANAILIDHHLTYSAPQQPARNQPPDTQRAIIMPHIGVTAKFLSDIPLALTPHASISPPWAVKGREGYPFSNGRLPVEVGKRPLF
jgi:hypothetical protein